MRSDFLVTHNSQLITHNYSLLLINYSLLMKRRDFIYTASSFLLPALVDGMGAKAFSKPNSPFMAALMEVADKTDNVLVVIQLSGGNDSLNMVIPLDQMSTYNSLRANIALPETKVLKLKGFDATGLHPSMTGLQGLFNEGKVSIVQAVSYPNPSFSHSRGTDIWSTSVDSNQLATSGWIGRYMEDRFKGYPDGYPNTQMPDPLAIQIGYISSTALLGENRSVSIAIPDPDTFAKLVGDKPNTIPGGTTNTPAGKYIEFIRQQQVSSVQYAGQIKTAAAKAVNLVTYPTGNGLADQLKIVARLIGGGLQTKVYYVTLGGFDTHSAQTSATDTTTGSHANLMKNLSEAITSFQNDIKLMGKDDRVVGMTFSEFGRRAISNGSVGTDHGWAAAQFVFGNAVKQQMIGKNPNLSDLDNSNLKMQNDFRTVYSAILEDFFGASQTSETTTLLKDFVPAPIFRQSAITATEPNFASDFNIYPNPASDEVILNSEAFTRGMEGLQVTDLQGREMNLTKEQIASNQVRMNVSNLNTGRYIVRMPTSQEPITAVLMVAR